MSAIFKHLQANQKSAFALKTRVQKRAKRYQTVALVTGYWRPGENYHERIIEVLENRVQEGDVVTVSEKAISTAMGSLVDEKPIKAGAAARFLARYWMRGAWAHMLGALCHLRSKTVARFRDYPIGEGSKHKQLVLERAGFLQALMHGSEGGIDGSNVPYSYVSIPLRDPKRIAEKIRERIRTELRTNAAVMIVDTDKTYSYRNFHFTPRPNPIKGIQSCGGVFSYVFGRFFRLETRSTPIALSGSEMSAETALQIAETANRTRGYGAGRNVWDMAETFHVHLTEVTWKMLEQVEHKPIVIVRLKRKNT